MRLTERARFAPELRNLSMMLPRASISRRTLPLMRRMDARLRSRSADSASTAMVGDISCRVHEPLTALDGSRPALLWIHGGGYLMGTPAQDDPLCKEVASKLGAVVAAPDYRVAPEHPYPTPLNDCHDALEWLAKRDDVDPNRIAIGGASAGGGLAAALTLLARERGVVRPVFQLLSYPMLDDRTTMRTDLDDKHARLWNSKSNRYGWSNYLGVAPKRVDTFASAARATDLSGLPPAWVGVGTLDVLHDEGLAYAQRLRDAGVSCDIEEVQGAFHGFDSVAPKATITRAFRESQLRALSGAYGV